MPTLRQRHALSFAPLHDLPEARPLPQASRAGRLGLGLVVLVALGWGAGPAAAQSGSFLLKPGSNVGPATKVKPVNCVTAPDGSVTCSTAIENSPSDTPAKPEYNPFRN